MLQIPPPPSITPRQMNLLRIVAAMAWSDGHLAAEEVTLMLERLSRIFSTNAAQQKVLQQEMREYLMQHLPLSELVSKLESDAERALVLRLGYEVICCSARTPSEPTINAEEAAAYQTLVQLLGLSPETVRQIEAAVAAEVNAPKGIADWLSHTLEDFVHQ
ncbi:TerB family tellurite resistance protein [Stenomitos frigidus]|uniref:Branched-chain amino acid ABC transporter ATP-binding protein n=1 Tax=Stenomitos frigidus ULC18 TaxID=2107698 RepID=A0A2T1E9P0_9CYAN|nr:TerB family tellurite resistance protein [Stenomitos frigidus]PSB29469.1 branched-chain amino acid ABC transporter ATP-binding protein [Stenomitos frigidus ULC18]